MNNIKKFNNGSTWLRADFHLHTRADNEFKYDGNPNEFTKEYIKRLKENEIGIGVITNHNKFAHDEFKDLYSKAKKEEIFLLPGVELSVKDGANGIHCLIVFNYEEWYKDGTDFISHFLISAFEGVSNYENENARCKYSLKETLEKLDEHRMSGRDSFIIMAHIEDRCGFYNELEGGRISELSKDELFRSLVLGFQKVRTGDYIKNLNIWLNDKLPLFLEGSDCKNLEEVGKPHVQKNVDKATYIKLGDFNFDAVKYSLLPTSKRISDKIPQIKNGYIESISFTGGLLNNESLLFNNNMNNLIGIRGSGKSTVLETIRYGLDVPFGSNSKDTNYKSDIVYNLMRSGGMLEIVLKDKLNKSYKVQRVYNEKPNVYRDDTLIPFLKINENLLNILYFGQKDLSEIGEEGFGADLINKFFGHKVSDTREKINNQKQEIIKIIREIKDLRKDLEKKNEILEEKTGVEEKLKKYAEHNIQDKLKKQLNFEKDDNSINQLTSFLKSMVVDLESQLNDYKDNFAKLLKYNSEENKLVFEKVNVAGVEINQSIAAMHTLIAKIKINAAQIDTYKTEFKDVYTKLKDEFAQIKRTINVAQINPDDFVKLHSRLNMLNTMIDELSKRAEKFTLMERRLVESLNNLERLYHTEFNDLIGAITDLNNKGLAVTINLEYKNDRESFSKFLEDNLKGTRIQKANLKKITDKYTDTLQIFKDLYNNNSDLANFLGGGEQLTNFRQRFIEYQETFLTYRVPDKYVLLYKGIELNKLSLGQRASALILFILTKEDNDVVIIDQPEDDLDNQTIYSDVIREITRLKSKTQFIFATHNPNIPVLGDCEQTICCKFSTDKLETVSGSIDCKLIQKEIVNIMEGGEEAFNKRNMVYQIWRD
ncbi:MAG: TrlF family AAA-like ATPase [Bacteroidota bacterium]